MKHINLCMSGGQTSAYLVEHVLKAQSEQGLFADIHFVITFANTSREHEETLVFVNKCDKRWQELYGHKVVWLEALVHHDSKKPCSHKVVNFETAKRNGEVFQQVVMKYGLPNNQFLHCTRELKENPIMSYMVSFGEQIGHIRKGKVIPATYETWIGIREDEPRRLKGNRNGKQRKVYPLAESVGALDIACDKPDVLEFWDSMPFKLNLEEHWGNCIDCHKKSEKKLKKVYIESSGNAFDVANKLDTLYSKVKPQILEDGTIKCRKRYRGYKNTQELIATFNMALDLSNESSDCETSCEPFMGENQPQELEFIENPKT